MSNDSTHKMVQDAYARIARKQGSSCCGGGNGANAPAPAKKSCCESKTAYAVPDHPVPESELGLSCGNPLAFGHIQEGDVVLDLGSGAGKDVFLAAQKTGDAGRVIGVDMTPEMLALARRNAVKFLAATHLANVEFREGRIESLPAEDASVDVVISNCVINLSPDKPRVFREIHRVLRPGGRMIVSDIVLNHPLSDEARNNAALYAACVAGALLRENYIQAIRDAGFEKVEVLSDQAYQAPSEPVAESACCDATEFPAAAAASLTVLAVK